MKPSIYACLTTRDGSIRNEVMACFMSAINHAQQAGLKIGAGRQQFAHGTATCRNMVVADFLAHTDSSHLLFVDDDVLLPAESIVQLVQSLTQPDVAIVCGAYPTFRFVGSQHAYLYLTARPVGGDWLTEWPPGLVEIDAGGTGCMAIHRDVFAAVGFPWFRWPEKHDPVAGTVEWVSDDVDFCAAARRKSFRVWCDGRVQPGHLKLTDLKILLNGALKWGIAPADSEGAYGSHVGVLRMLGKALPIDTVVEYGTGKYSTPLFLDRTAFHYLDLLISYESNPEWAAKVREANPDPRLNLIEMPLEEFPSSHTWRSANLVFIDCDTVKDNQHDYSVRVQLIERYQTDPHAVVVVHDANFTAIAPAVRASTFKHKAMYVPPNGPHTAILSNAVDVGKLLKGAK